MATQVGIRKKVEFDVARFVDHPSFHAADAETLYRTIGGGPEGALPRESHLPDERTRDLAKGMHYAAFRVSGACRSGEARIWRKRFLDLRDRIILGNHKLIYRAVHTRVRDPQFAEDCVSDCHLVMIRVVSSYNPWLGIRFSTYAFTCLLRELSRLVQKQRKDRLRNAASFDNVWRDHTFEAAPIEAGSDGPEADVRQFLATGHPLLSDREKQILSQRFGFNSDGATAKLKDIGNDLRISKERVRQLQSSGLGKLREAFAAECVGV